MKTRMSLTRCCCDEPTVDYCVGCQLYPDGYMPQTVTVDFDMPPPPAGWDYRVFNSVIRGPLSSRVNGLKTLFREDPEDSSPNNCAHVLEIDSTGLTVGSFDPNATQHPVSRAEVKFNPNMHASVNVQYNGPFIAGIRLANWGGNEFYNHCGTGQVGPVQPVDDIAIVRWLGGGSWELDTIPNGNTEAWMGDVCGGPCEPCIRMVRDDHTEAFNQTPINDGSENMVWTPFWQFYPQSPSVNSGDWFHTVGTIGLRCQVDREMKIHFKNIRGQPTANVATGDFYINTSWPDVYIYLDGDSPQSNWIRRAGDLLIAPFTDGDNLTWHTDCPNWVVRLILNEGLPGETEVGQFPMFDLQWNPWCLLGNCREVIATQKNQQLDGIGTRIAEVVVDYI